MQIHAEQAVVEAVIQDVITLVIQHVPILAQILVKLVLSNVQADVVGNATILAQEGAKALACTDAQGAVNQAALGVAQQVVRTLAKDSATILAKEAVKADVAANALQVLIAVRLEQGTNLNF